MGADYPNLTTMGIEIELEDITPHQFGIGRFNGMWNTTHDASIESDRIQTPSGIILKNLPQDLFGLNLQKVQTGVELVSIPLDTENTDLMGVLKDLTHYLYELGETSESCRAGIHFHISYPKILKFIKAAVKLGCWLEDVMFYIGGQGYVFRGMVINDNAFCRPITKWGPPCVPAHGGDWYQVFNVEDLMDAHSSKDFWARYGDCNMLMPPARYVPQRYTWLNFYSLLAHGTLEFRLFNKTLNPLYIYAEAQLCKAFCEYAVYNASEILHDDLPMHSIYDGRSKADIIRTLHKFATRTSLGSQMSLVTTLERIIVRTPEIAFPKVYMASHLRDLNEGFTSGNFIPDKVRGEVQRPNVIDIHRLRGER